MSAHPPDPIAVKSRPWLDRRPGECAFPVDGRGWRTRSCCNPCGRETYCRAHRRLTRLKGTAITPDQLLAALVALRLVEP